jgi:hypothetical protein
LTGCRRPQDCIQAIKAASDRGLAAFRAPDLQRMKLLLPVARSYRVSFLLGEKIRLMLLLS